jgi:hypothetical protein
LVVGEFALADARLLGDRERRGCDACRSPRLDPGTNAYTLPRAERTAGQEALARTGRVGPQAPAVVAAARAGHAHREHFRSVGAEEADLGVRRRVRGAWQRRHGDGVGLCRGDRAPIAEQRGCVRGRAPARRETGRQGGSCAEEPRKALIPNRCRSCWLEATAATSARTAEAKMSLLGVGSQSRPPPEGQDRFECSDSAYHPANASL